jgi:hypothetical protein
MWNMLGISAFIFYYFCLVNYLIELETETQF